MAHVRIDGRDYPIPAAFTLGELAEMKRLTGFRPTELGEALAMGDPDVVVAVACVCARRAGSAVTPQAIYDMSTEFVEIVMGDEDDGGAGGADPPGEAAGAAPPKKRAKG